MRRGAEALTWSIIARDGRGRGADRRSRSSTKFFAVGARVPFDRDRVGAVASAGLRQSRSTASAASRCCAPACRPRTWSASLTAADAGHPHRQVHVMDRDGRFAAHTGAECVDWCGHLVRDTFSVAGNMLAGPQVIEETARGLRGRVPPCPSRAGCIAALKAGEDAGGDKRGKQSAALLIYVDRGLLRSRPAGRRPRRSARRARASREGQPRALRPLPQVPAETRRPGRRHRPRRDQAAIDEGASPARGHDP